MALRRFMFLVKVPMFVCILLCVIAVSAQVQPQAAEPKIKPERVLDQYERAAGLTELASLKNVHIKAQMRPLDLGNVQDFDGVYAADGRMRELTSTREDSMLASDHASGFDGKEYWSADTEKWKPGIVFWQDHSEATKHRSPFLSYFLPFDPGWRTNSEHHFSVIGAAMVKDRKTIVIQDERDESHSTYYYFDSESFLLLRLDSVLKRASVKKPQSRPYVTTLLFSNYKPVGALQIPRTIRMDDRLELIVDSVELNANFAEKDYNRP